MAERRSGSTAALAIAALGGVTLARRRRRRRLAGIATALHDAVLSPGVGTEGAERRERVDDEAHAPGHRHLAPPPDERLPRSVRRRGLRGDRAGHPGRFG